MAHARYEWSGSSVIDTYGNVIQRHSKRFYVPCPSTAMWWPMNKFRATREVRLQHLVGYCWPTDPKSCSVCALPPVFAKDAARAEIWDTATGFLTGGLRPITSTRAARVGSDADFFCLDGVWGVPKVEVNGIYGAWGDVYVTHNYSAELSDEYTEAEALANAYVYNTNGSTAENNPRVQGVVSRYTDVGFQLRCTELLAGRQYVARVVLFNVTTAVSTPVTYTFTAAGTTHTITGTIPTPPAGQAVQVKSPSISYAT
jgi:hypothetical protein